MSTVWARIPEFPDYAVSGDGEVMRITDGGPNAKSGLVLQTYIRNQYPAVNLYRNRKMFPHSVHRLIAKGFIPNPENKPQVNHIDGNRLHSYYSNLEWYTSRENVRHALNTGLRGKLDRKSVAEIRRLREAGTPQAEIAQKFNIVPSHVSKICGGERWN